MAGLSKAYALLILQTHSVSTSQVIEILGPILDDVVAKQPTLDAIVVDQLDLGEAPLRLAGVKVYNTKDDEVIMECPIQWGSLLKVRFLLSDAVIHIYALSSHGTACTARDGEYYLHQEYSSRIFSCYRK